MNSRKGRSGGNRRASIPSHKQEDELGWRLVEFSADMRFSAGPVLSLVAIGAGLGLFVGIFPGMPALGNCIVFGAIVGTMVWAGLWLTTGVLGLLIELAVWLVRMHRQRRYRHILRTLLFWTGFPLLFIGVCFTLNLGRDSDIETALRLRIGLGAVSVGAIVVATAFRIKRQPERPVSSGEPGSSRQAD